MRHDPIHTGGPGHGKFPSSRKIEIQDAPVVLLQEVYQPPICHWSAPTLAVTYKAASTRPKKISRTADHGPIHTIQAFALPREGSRSGLRLDLLPISKRYSEAARVVEIA
jgi:hypothetical protein